MFPQLNPNTSDGYTMYTFTLACETAAGSVTFTAYAVSAGSDYSSGTTTFTAGTEYWSVPASFVTAWNSTGYTTKQLSMTAATTDWSSPPQNWNTTFTRTALIPQTGKGAWKEMSSPPTTTLWFVNWGMDFPSAGGVNWYFGGASAPTGSYILTSSNMPSFNVPTAPAGMTTFWKL